MRKKIDVYDLRHGMWVSELDCPWRETPFLFQGFEIESDEHIEELKSYCKHVYVDTDLGCDSAPPASAGISYTNTLPDELDRRQATYQEQTSIEEEIQVAKNIHQSGTQAIAEIMDDVHLGKKISITRVKQAVGGMVESIVRNPDAFAWLAQLKNKDSYTYSHCLDTCALGLIFGRHLGISKEELKVLGTGTLLLDIGKMRMPAELLEKPGKLTEKEFQIMKTHVGHSVEIMRGRKAMPAAAIEMAATHHERHNGEGYPLNLMGKEIPIFGKIAGIVDCYDAVTSDRVYRSAISPHKALRMLYAGNDKDFQAALVEQFIQCIGIYPVGGLVELSTGEIGIVLSQNRVRRLRPKVMLILDRDKKPHKTAPTIDLLTQVSDASGNPLEIKEALEPGAHGINPKEFYL